MLFQAPAITSNIFNWRDRVGMTNKNKTKKIDISENLISIFQIINENLDGFAKNPSSTQAGIFDILASGK